MQFAVSRTVKSLRVKTKSGLFAFGLLAAMSVLTHAPAARAGVFDPTYANPVFSCTTGTGCCLQANLLVRDMFTGSGLYAGQADLQRSYYLNDLANKFKIALQQMSKEYTNDLNARLAAMGAMIDGQNLNYTTLTLGKQTTDTLKKEVVSEQICRFGTMSRSLASSDDQSRVVQVGLSTQMLQRDLMRDGLASANMKAVGSQLGRTSDKNYRLAQFKQRFCDKKDSDGAMNCTANNDKLFNADINVAASLYNPMTLNLNFTPSGVDTRTDDEETIMALASNLFAHDLPVNFGEGDFNAILKDNGQASDARKEKLMDYRALTAKRTVAQNSFAALTAMKAEGTAGAGTYMKQMLEQMGLDATNQTKYLGTNPSYSAQMDFLTRKIYQSPAFYANLMDSRENVQRQQAAMEGIALMQDRDTYESLRRSEMVLSTLLEMYLVKEQSAAKDRGTK